MVAYPHFIRTGQDFHPYIVVAVFQELRAARNISVGLEICKNLLPCMLAPTVIQQYRFYEMFIQKRWEICISIMLHRIDRGLCLCLFVRISPINTETRTRTGIINSGTIIGKAIRFHCSRHIALRRSLRFFQGGVVQLIIKAVFKMMIDSDVVQIGPVISKGGKCITSRPCWFFTY